jgi:hypothetical protein
MHRLLCDAFDGFNADIRPLLEQTDSTPADHESTDRLSYADLRAITRINEAHAATPVLNSGKHFKIAQELLWQRYPGIPIIGIFMARCVRSNDD